MGYTIAAHARNAQDLRAMLAFMEKHFRKSDEVFGTGSYSRLAIGKDLSYDDNKLAIGFDFNVAEPERDYIFAVTRWMALKVGRLVRLKGFESPVSCTYYDGGTTDDDRWPVLVRNEWKSKAGKWDWCLTDQYGFKSSNRKFIGTPLYKSSSPTEQKKLLEKHSHLLKELCGYTFEEMDRLILKELKLLDKAWNNEHTNR